MNIEKILDYLCIIVFMLIVAYLLTMWSDTTVHSNELKQATVLCENHGGISSIDMWFYDRVTCQDSVTFRLTNINGDRTKELNSK